MRRLSLRFQIDEVLQGDATPEYLSRQLLPLLDPASQERATMKARLAKIKGALGKTGAADRVADMAVEILEGRVGIPAPLGRES